MEKQETKQSSVLVTDEMIEKIQEDLSRAGRDYSIVKVELEDQKQQLRYIRTLLDELVTDRSRRDTIKKGVFDKLFSFLSGSKS